MRYSCRDGGTSPAPLRGVTPFTSLPLTRALRFSISLSAGTPLLHALDPALGPGPHVPGRGAADMERKIVDRQGLVLVEPLHGPVCDDRAVTR